MPQLTLQIFHHSQWHDAAILTIPEPTKGRSGVCHLGYEQRYAIEYMFDSNEKACSVRLPVELIQHYTQTNWFSFLEDIMPSGSSRRYWVTKLGISNLSEHQQDYTLLQHATIAPIGNIRIKESLPSAAKESTLASVRFTIDDVVERDGNFLEYAQEMGAASGGATGAGGEAPKFLIRCSEKNEIWVDSYQDDLTTTDTHYLVKFPRGSRSKIDCDILRAEYHYYHELHALGIKTIDTASMRLIEGRQYPSLWLPRFDVNFNGNELVRYGMESVYSILSKPAGSGLKHIETINSIIQTLTQNSPSNIRFDAKQFVMEWIKRDLLNIAFGNSDNHGRNTAFLKTENNIELSPIYDFAPMKADPEGVIRMTKWGAPYEEAGNYQWDAICAQFPEYVDPYQLFHEIKSLAKKLLGLNERLRKRGVPESILAMPAVGLSTLDNKLKDWGLI